MRSTTSTPLTLALVSALLATVAGCGGSDDNDSAAPPPPPAPPPPAQVTLQGSAMRNAALQNAVVCMDLNANSACDAGEPASAPTDANGAWSLAYDTAQVSADQVATASVIALVTPATIDAGRNGESATTQPYVLRQVPGKSGQINPLTTLVAQGMQDGMTEAMARSNAALQLGIVEAKIDNYQDDPAAGPEQVQDNARTLAAFTANALEDGAVLQVGDQMAAREASDGDLAMLQYTDNANYKVRYVSNLAKPEGSVYSPYTENVVAVKNGVASTDPMELYPALYLTPAGWKRCTAATQHFATVGNPSRDLYCSNRVSARYSVDRDIAGKSMASTIQELQALPAGNTINNGMSIDNLLATVGSTLHPAGSKLRHRTVLQLNQPLFISDTRTQLVIPQAQATTLEQLVAARPASAVNLATSAGSLSLGASTSAQRNLRVAFTGATGPAEGTVQFYDCALNSASAPSNCSATNTGTYHIYDTVNGVRVMVFSGYAPTTASGEVNFYAENKGTPNGDFIFRARQSKPTLALAISDNYRVNGAAWAPAKAQLGL